MQHSSSLDMDQRWPPLLGKPNGHAKLRAVLEDFRVDEIPAYDPCGTGEHLFVKIEKSGLTTDQVLGQMAKHLGIKTRDMGTAGLKDRLAITTQWVSIPARASSALDTMDIQGVQIIDSKKHTNKLKTGHLKGNHFSITLRDVDDETIAEMGKRCSLIRAKGCPNYFGPQRFGARGDNEAEGRAILQGKGRRHDRRGLRFMLNALQSALFNDVLAQRISKGMFSRVLDGDILIKADTGGRFLCTDPKLDQSRADDFLVHPSGPMFGPKMAEPKGIAQQMERDVLMNSGLNMEHWKKFAKLTSGARRALRLDVKSLRMTHGQDWVKLSFELPAGAYATSLIRELVNT